MEQRHDTPTGPGDAVVTGAARVRDALRGSWQVWLLVVAVGLLVAGGAAAWLRAERPDVGRPLHDVELLLALERYEEAVETLNRDVFPYLDESGVPVAARAQYHLLLARGLYGAQHALEADVEGHNRKVAESFVEAERHGAALEPSDVYALADTYLRLGRPDLAMDRSAALPERQAELKRRIAKRSVEWELASEAADHDFVSRQLASMLGDPDLPAIERAWCLARQAELRYARGAVEEAVGRLVQSIVRLRERIPDTPELGELHLLLGTGHFLLGEYDEAGAQLGLATTMFSAIDPRRGRAELLIAGSEERCGDPAAARDRYVTLVREWEHSPVLPSALLGLAESRHVIGEGEEALETYEELVRVMRDRSPTEPTRERVTQSLLARYGERYHAGDTVGALRYAQLSERLYTIDDAPADVLLALAEVHRRAAEEMLGGDHGDDEGSRGGAAWQQRVQEHLLRAGEYYAEHMNRVVLADNDAYARSLWLAADSFDRAGDRERAIRRLREYASGFPDDPRQAEARFRLARAYQSLGDSEAAADEFRALIADRGGAKGVGPWGDASYVLLAQVLLADGNPESDAEAEEMLTTVVHGAIGDAGSAAYRDALYELGAYLYRVGRHREALERLEEAVRRYPDDPQADAVRFRLADSYRLISSRIGEELSREAMPSVRQRELALLREDYLRRALTLFEEVRAGFESVDPGRRTLLDEVILRNAYLYLGDCAMDLGEFEAAIRHYTAARDRYPRDPASLVALVQIVNAHMAKGEYELARTSNERARRFFLSLPEEVWDDPYLPMSRQDWEQWLNAMLELDRPASDRRSSAGP